MSNEKKRIDNKWSENNEKRLKWLYNLLKKEEPDLVYENYILNYNKKKLVKFIKSTDLGNSSKEALFFTVSKWLQMNTKSTTYKPFSLEGYKLKEKIRNDDGDNEIDVEHKESYRNFSYFTNILDSIKFKEINDIKKHYEYLLLSLLIYQPPLRTNFYSSAEISNKSNTDDNINYLWLNYQGKPRAYYLVNKDKISNSTKIKEDFTKSIIEIEDKKIIDIIYYSFEKYPRQYLFQNKNGSKISEDTLRNYLRDITKLPNINFDIMRSIFITHSYDTTAKTFKKREELASKMRHSQQIAGRAYFKVESEKKEPNQEIDELKKQVELLILENNELKQKIKEYEPDEKLYNKRRNDVLFRLNNSNGKSKAKPDTLNKYKIIFNNATNKYV